MLVNDRNPFQGPRVLNKNIPDVKVNGFKPGYRFTNIFMLC